MKIKFNETTCRISIGSLSMVLTKKEIEKAADTQAAFIDLDHTLRVSYNEFSITKLPWQPFSSSDCGDAQYFRYNIDGTRICRTLLKVWDNVNEIEIDPDSFKGRQKYKPVMNWSQIWNHPNFKAHKNLKNAVRNKRVKTCDWGLKEMLDNKLSAGFEVYDDFHDTSFYFSKRDGQLISNGGIIDHKDGYSTHT